jgi:hypothetical protein
MRFAPLIALAALTGVLASPVPAPERRDTAPAVEARLLGGVIGDLVDLFTPNHGYCNTYKVKARCEAQHLEFDAYNCCCKHPVDTCE